MAILILICLLLTLGCARAGYRFLTMRKQGEHRIAFVYKGMAGVCFVTISALLALYRGSISSFRIVAGLVCGLLGDQLLAMRTIYPQRHDLYFCSGAISFSIGHICYLLALGQLMTKPFFTVLPAFGVLVILSLLYMVLQKIHAGKMQMFSILYVGIVALVCAAALCAATQTRTAGTRMLFLGALCFFISDNLLIGYTFGPAKTRKLNIALHITYYMAQLLIGWSILLS